MIEIISSFPFAYTNLILFILIYFAVWYTIFIMYQYDTLVSVL